MKLVNSIVKFFVKSNLLLSFLFSVICFNNCECFLVFKYFPDDYLQGNLVRIMCIHIPVAWISMGLCTVIAVSSIIFLIRKVILFDIVAKSSAYVLLGVIGIALVTGSIWGKPGVERMVGLGCEINLNVSTIFYNSVLYF
ncbi:MAG: cytochrome c biogenesis protein [Candidatus Midichloria sp.]|nr:MAG: cytochrome c biogenesis protein [Candidatus Midichloria sp.]